MVHRFIVVAALVAPLPVVVATEQDPAVEPAEHVAAEDADALATLIDRLYATVSFDEGEQPDWEALRAMTFDGATFVQPTREGMARQSTDEFIAKFQEEIRTRDAYDDGFYERVANHQTRVFGRVAHSFVVFEVRLGSPDAPLRGRGLDSIHFVKHGGSWRISSIVTEHERRDRPIPAAFLTPR